MSESVSERGQWADVCVIGTLIDTAAIRELDLLERAFQLLDPMNIKALRIFVSVMEDGTLSRASERVHSSAPAASRLLKLLEEDLGAPLFIRDSGGLTPTREADLFYPEAVRALAAIDYLQVSFNDIRKESVRPLRVACHPRLVQNLVTSAIAKLAKIAPDTRVSLEVRSRKDLPHRVAKNLHDVSVGSMPVSSELVQSEELCRSKLYVLVPKGSKLSVERRLTIEKLSAVPYIALEQSALLRQMVDRLVEAGGNQLAPTYEVSTANAACCLVQDGLGFCVVDPLGMDRSFSLSITAVPLEPTTEFTYGVFQNPNFDQHPATQDFIRCLRETSYEAMALFERP